MWDAVVIGAGVTGCATARELSRFQLKILVIEKGSDVCSGASKGNSAMVHSGFDPSPGTQKAKFNILGNRMFYDLCVKLEVPFRRDGTLILAVNREEMAQIASLHEQGIKNGAETHILINEMLERFRVGPGVLGALFAPDGGVVCPYELVIAMAECAASNGAHFMLNTKVEEIVRRGGAWRLRLSDQSILSARVVINCAGTDADRIHNMVSADHLRIIPRFGGHLIMGRGDLGELPCTVTQAPSVLPTGGHTKGMGMTPSVDGTVLLGCDAVDQSDPDDTSLSGKSIQNILEYFTQNWEHYPPARQIKQFPRDKVIGAYGGLRPHCTRNDFVIGQPEDADLFFEAAGIESPGLTAGPAIGEFLARMAAEALNARERPDFDPTRHRIRPFREMDQLERARASTEDPDYAKIVCSCELVTLAEIRNAIHRPLGARTISAVKMRTRAGMGRCQGGFCESKIAEILSKELDLDMLSILRAGPGSQLLTGRITGRQG